MYTIVMVAAPFIFLFFLTSAIIIAVRQSNVKNNSPSDPSLVELNTIQYTINPKHNNQGHFKLQSDKGAGRLYCNGGNHNEEEEALQPEVNTKGWKFCGI